MVKLSGATHLGPAHQAIASLPDEERIQWIRAERWISHPAAEMALTAMGDLLTYEAFASEGLDNPWHLARRRRPGPIDFATLPLDERHMLLATATVLTGSVQLRRRFYPPLGTRQDDVATLTKRLRDADRTEWRERQRRWPDAAQVPNGSGS